MCRTEYCQSCWSVAAHVVISMYLHWKQEQALLYIYIYLYILDNFAGRYTWKAWWCNIKSIKTSSIKSPRPWWQLAALPEEYEWQGLSGNPWELSEKSWILHYQDMETQFPLGFKFLDPTLGTTLWLFMMFMFYLLTIVICIQLFGLWETLWTRPSSSLEVAFPATNHQNILLWIFIHSKKEKHPFSPLPVLKKSCSNPHWILAKKNEAFNRFEHDWFIMKP